MEVRQALNIGVAGARGHGKSSLVNKLVTEACKYKKNALLYKLQMNLHDEAFPKFKALDKLSDYSGGFAKIGSSSIGYKDFLIEVMNSFKNGSVIIDDAKLFERHTLSQEATSFLTMSRHLGIDVYYVYHSLKYIPIEMYEGLDWLILFHTTENIQSKLSALPSGNKLVPAVERVSKQIAKGNKYYHEYIKLTG